MTRDPITTLVMVKAVLTMVKKTTLKQLWLNRLNYIRFPETVLLNWDGIIVKYLDDQELETVIIDNLDAIFKGYSIPLENPLVDIDRSIDNINKELLLRLSALKEVQNLE